MGFFATTFLDCDGPTLRKKLFQKISCDYKKRRLRMADGFLNPIPLLPVYAVTQKDT